MSKQKFKTDSCKRKKRLFGSVVTAAIVLIPTIYTTLFLGSMWDPYGSVDSLPVAVVNQDQAVSYQGKTLAVGEELVEHMQEDPQLDFHFVDADDAQQGLQDGTYYMVITIPENFSENATTLLDETPQKMQLMYETNPGTNYIASKMSESAIAKIDKQISESVTQQYTETIFSQIGEIRDGMDDAADGAYQLYDGVLQLSDGNQTITENLTLLAESSLIFVEGTETLENGLGTYTAGVSSLQDGTAALSDGINRLSKGADSLSSGVELLSDGSASLYDGVETYTDGVSSAYLGLQALSKNNNSLRAGASSVADGASQLQSGSQALADGLLTLSDTLNNSLTEEQQATLAQLSDGLIQLQKGIDTLNNTLQSTTLSETDTLVQTLTNSLTQIGTCAQDAGTQITTLQSALTAMTQTQAFQSLDAAAQVELLSSFSTPLETLAVDADSIGTQVTTILGSLEAANLDGISDTVAQLQSGVAALATSADQLLPGTNQAIETLSDGMQSVQVAVEEQLLPGAVSLADGAHFLSDGSESLQLGINDYTGGVSSLTDGLCTLDANTAALLIGADTLSNGASKINSDLPTMTSAVSQLQTGASQLDAGAMELVSNQTSLLDGASQLTNGAQQMQIGASQLADGSVKLGEGLIDAEDGAETLQHALNDGAEEITSLNPTDDTYNMFAAPVETNETYQTQVANNGSAMAAYMMAVGLWVAGLAMCVMESPHEQKIKSINAGRAWCIQLMKIWALAIAQAVVMVLSLTLINGFSPEYLLRTIVVACLTAMAFLTLEYCVNFFLGVVGSFLLLVFMVLQLSGCAGTYPLELSDRFYQILNPFMPFTYAVHGFRSGIASGTDVTMDCMILAIIALVSAAVLLVGFHCRLHKQEESGEDVAFYKPKPKSEHLFIEG